MTRRPLAVAGTVMISVGVWILGLVGWSLWGTGLLSAAAQDSLGDRWATLRATTGDPVEHPGDHAADSTVPPGAPEVTVPVPDGDPTPATTPATTTTTVPAPPDGLAPGDPVARLIIERIGLDTIVVEGVGTTQLATGPGRYPGTRWFGAGGTTGIAGHRTTYGAPFFRLDELAPGDPVVVETLDGRTLTYRVVSTRIVTPDSTWVLADTGVDRLVLTTCHPRYSARRRLVVTADADPPAADPAPASTGDPDPDPGPAPDGAGDPGPAPDGAGDPGPAPDGAGGGTGDDPGTGPATSAGTDPHSRTEQGTAQGTSQGAGPGVAPEPGAGWQVRAGRLAAWWLEHPAGALVAAAAGSAAAAGAVASRRHLRVVLVVTGAVCATAASVPLWDLITGWLLTPRV